MLLDACFRKTKSLWKKYQSNLIWNNLKLNISLNRNLNSHLLIILGKTTPDLILIIFLVVVKKKRKTKLLSFLNLSGMISTRNWLDLR